MEPTLSLFRSPFRGHERAALFMLSTMFSRTIANLLAKLHGYFSLMTSSESKDAFLLVFKTLDRCVFLFSYLQYKSHHPESSTLTTSEATLSGISTFAWLFLGVGKDIYFLTIYYLFIVSSYDSNLISMKSY